MRKIIDFIRSNLNTWLTTLLACVIIYFQVYNLDTKTPEFKEFKDGVQNHLLWSIKGECFFVKPQTEKTVYLVRVEDCDRK
ncbi:MAG: hypothetical protein EBS86_17980 [Crocinitomicaceae bacterium]|nr:hypothetical protein [Crocinitomicaceae bacterium]